MNYQTRMLRRAELEQERKIANLVKMTWCPFCHEEMFDDGFQHDVWDKMRFGESTNVSEEEWMRQAKRHKPNCAWIRHRGSIIFSA